MRSTHDHECTFVGVRRREEEMNTSKSREAREER
jgi:hypothetical protein